MRLLVFIYFVGISACHKNISMVELYFPAMFEYAVVVNYTSNPLTYTSL